MRHTVALPVPGRIYHAAVRGGAPYLWRCVTEARGLDGREATRIRIAVNGRARMVRPRVPEGYTGGSVVLWARPATTARELLDRSLRYAAELISREVARIDDTPTSDRSSISRAPGQWRRRSSWCRRPTRQRSRCARTSTSTACYASDPVPQAGLRLWLPAFFFRPGYGRRCQ